MSRAWLALLLVTSCAAGPPAFGPATVGAPRSGLPGEYFRPAGAGPFPAMVVLHGCAGVGPHSRNWARRLRAWGYAALVVDSFGPRGVREVCGRGLEVPPEAQAADAVRAAAWLREQPEIAPAEVGVIGFSHGGWAVLKAVLADAAGPSPFAAAIAYYPGCQRPTAPLATDTLILLGGDDDWTPPNRCLRWAAAVTRAGHAVETQVYPGAVHAFDTTAPLHMAFGHHLGGDPAAAASSEVAARAFLAARLHPAAAP